MSKFHRASKEKILQIWEQVVLVHKRWKDNPSAKCAWTLFKITVSLLLQLARLYIEWT